MVIVIAWCSVVESVVKSGSVIISVKGMEW